MKKLVKLLSFLLLLGMLVGVTQASAETEDFTVKVKLINDYGPKGPYSSYYFEPKGDSVLKEKSSVVLSKNKKYTVLVANQKLTIKDGATVVAEGLATITIEPKVYNKANHVYIYRGDKPDVKHPYMGTVIFRIPSGTTQIQPVNHLLVEDYLKGVLPGETPASWGNNGGMEALKAQAIAARSYVYSKTSGKFTTEIDDSTDYQMFKGFIWDPTSPKYLASYANTNKAVDETAGLVMTYKLRDGKDGFVASFFSSSNGGHTELPQQYWSGTLPYITKAKPDPYDIGNTDWELTWLKQQLSSSLDLSKPEGWWNSVGEYGLSAANMPTANDAKAFLAFKLRVLSDLKKQDSTIESIKISSIDSMTKKDYENTGKVSEIITNISYYTRHTNGSTVSYDMMPGAQSKTLAGDLRYDTAVAVAREYVGAAKADTIVLGRGDIPADALAGTVLAHKYNAPLMLTRSDSLPASVDTFIKEKVNPGAKVYLLGGTSAITPQLEAALKARGFVVERLSGNDRTATSIAIAKEVGSVNGKAILASASYNSSDALSASAYAAAKQIPVIIHFGQKAAQQTKDYLASSGTQSVTVIGGTGPIPEAVSAELAKSYSVERIGGETRVDTSIAVNQQLPLNGENIVIANAYQFVDSLAGSVLAAKTGSPIVLLHPDAANMPTEFFNSLPAKKQAYFLGGSGVISEDLKNAVNEYVAGELNKKKMSVTFKGSNKTTYADTMLSYRTLLGVTVLKSLDFDLITNQSDRIVMDGAGYGHGIGMSQYGALRRAQDGQLAPEILQFYYDNIEIKSKNLIVQ